MPRLCFISFSLGFCTEISSHISSPTFKAGLNPDDLRTCNFGQFRWQQVRSSFENIRIFSRVIFPSVLIGWHSGRQLPDIFPTVWTNGQWCPVRHGSVLLVHYHKHQVRIQLIMVFSFANFNHIETSYILPISSKFKLKRSNTLFINTLEYIYMQTEEPKLNYREVSCKMS